MTTMGSKTFFILVISQEPESSKEDLPNVTPETVSKQVGYVLVFHFTVISHTVSIQL